MLQALQGRWTLDDVERISRGKSSKAKMGSRQVPHRLSAEERKAYDLAKKKGYLVVRVLSRQYPLVNTYRNFCDASNCPCIFIEQGREGVDNLVIDLTPLRLDEDNLRDLSEKVLETMQLLEENSTQDTEHDGDPKCRELNADEVQSFDQSREAKSEVEGILKFTLSRSGAKSMCQATWNMWQVSTKSESDSINYSLK